MKSFTAIPLFLSLLFTCAIATVPIRIMSDKHPCGCTGQQIKLVKAVVDETQKDLMSLRNVMSKPVSRAEGALLGRRSLEERTAYIRMLDDLAGNLRSLQTIDELNAPQVVTFYVICKNPSKLIQGTSSLYVLYLEPSFFGDSGVLLQVPVKVRLDREAYKKAKANDQGTVTPFENDYYPLPRNSVSIVMLWFLQRLPALQMPEHQSYKGRSNPRAFLALALVNKWDPEAMAILPPETTKSRFINALSRFKKKPKQPKPSPKPSPKFSPIRAQRRKPVPKFVPKFEAIEEESGSENPTHHKR